MDDDVLFAEAHAALDALAVFDLDSCDREALDQVLGRWKQVRSFCDVYEVRAARRARHLARQGRGETVEGMLGDHRRRPSREARAAAERERVCDQLPAFEDALGSGEVSGGHVDALAAATSGLDDASRERFATHGDDLLGQARWQSPEVFARECRELARNVSGDEGESLLAKQKRQCRLQRWIDTITGMHHIHAELDPETGTKAWNAINAMTANMRRTARHRAAADGTTDATTSDDAPRGPSARATKGSRGRASDPSAGASPSPPTDGKPTTAGADRGAPSPSATTEPDPADPARRPSRTLACETADGTMFPPSTVRRLCCQAEVFPVVLDGNGEPLDIGRERRLANRAQRRALRAMYRTCAHPSCTVEFDHCEIHHVIAWELGGPTDLYNLLPLCSRHHHLVHEGGWHLRLGAHRVITLTRPDGTVGFTGSTIDRTLGTNQRRRPHQLPGGVPDRPAGEPPGRRRTAA